MIPPGPITTGVTIACGAPEFPISPTCSRILFATHHDGLGDPGCRCGQGQRTGYRTSRHVVQRARSRSIQHPASGRHHVTSLQSTTIRSGILPSAVGQPLTEEVGLDRDHGPRADTIASGANQRIECDPGALVEPLLEEAVLAGADAMMTARTSILVRCEPRQGQNRPGARPPQGSARGSRLRQRRRRIAGGADFGR